MKEKKREKKEKQNEISLQKLIGKRIKRLRMECTDIEVLKQICLACDGCGYKKCATCNDRETISKTIAGNAEMGTGKPSAIKVEALANAMYKGSKTTINRLEQGEAIFGEKIRPDYEALFGESYVKEYVDGINDSFEKTSIKKRLHNFMCREKELEELEELVKNNIITIVHSDGGVGKTTLVDEYINRYGLGEYNYYQTIVCSDKEQFEREYFLNKIELSDKGKKELEEFEKTKDSQDKTKCKQEFICNKLNNLYVPALFFLDDFTSVGIEIVNLPAIFPKCRFIITTRSIRDITDKCDGIGKLELKHFTSEQALEMFNDQRKSSNSNIKPLSTEDFQPIYEYSEGNAETLYFIACMLGNESVESFNEFLTEQTFTAYDKTEGEQRSGKMAERLSKLFKFSKLFPNGISAMDNNDKKIRALAVLSITKMEKISRKSLVQFLTGDEESELVARNALRDLERYGFIKTDGESEWMHPLMANALSLNEIGFHYSNDVKVFSYLITNQENIAVKYGVTEMKTVVIPSGITKIGVGAFSGIIDAPCNYNVNLREQFSNIEKSNDSIIQNIVYQKPLFSLEKLVVPKWVKEIGAGAFDCELKEIEFSEGVEIIGEKAFSWFAGESIMIPSSVKKIENGAFFTSRRLKDLTISEGAEEIGIGAFSDSVINFIRLPDSLKRIEVGAFHSFRENPQLKEIYFGENLKYLGINNAFTNVEILRLSEKNATYYIEKSCIIKKEDNSLVLGCKTSVIPESITTIGACAFSFCETFGPELIIPKNVKKIGDKAFELCVAIEKVTMSDNVVDIGEQTFCGCHSLKEIRLSNQLTTIGQATFAQCFNLEHIEIPKNINKIGRCAFFQSDKLIYLEKDGARYLGNSDNPYHALIEISADIEEISIADGCIVVADGAFSDCKKISKLFIPKSVVTLVEYNFTALKEVSFEGTEETFTNKNIKLRSLTELNFSFRVNEKENPRKI